MIKKKSFTIVELLIYMGILSILILVLTEIVSSVISVKLSTKSTSTLEQDGRYILSRLIYDITRTDSNAGDAIVTPVSAGANSGTLQLSIAGINYSYTQDLNNNLTMTNNLGTDNLNGYNTRVTLLNFQRIGTSGPRDSIKISFTLTSKTISNTGNETKNFSTTVVLR